MRGEKETAMPPPTQTVSGQTTSEAEEGESHDFDQLAKLERMKSCVNSVKKLQVERERNENEE